MSAQSATSKESANRRTTWVVIGIVLVILAALVIALFSSDSSSGDDTADGGDSTVVVVNEENQPVTVTGAALASLQDPSVDPAVGTTAPKLEGLAFDGSPVVVQPGDGQAYLLVFLAHWCPHCNAEIPRLVTWFESGRVPENLRVIGVSTAVAADRPNYPPSKWIVETDWPWEIMADSADLSAASAYGVSGFPFFVIVGADGQVKVRQSGEVGIEALEQIVATALAS
ncbi:MAG: TlpA family protein disulfide reductase [Ilumatobacteraceae bacterium]